MACTNNQNQIRKEDTGTTFQVTVKDADDIIDISAATTLQLIFKKPSGETLTVTATLFTDGTDGIMEYTTATTAILNEIGTWSLQGYVVLGINNEWHTSLENFKVHRNLT